MFAIYVHYLICLFEDRFSRNYQFPWGIVKYSPYVNVSVLMKHNIYRIVVVVFCYLKYCQFSKKAYVVDRQFWQISKAWLYGELLKINTSHLFDSNQEFSPFLLLYGRFKLWIIFVRRRSRDAVRLVWWQWGWSCQFLDKLFCVSLGGSALAHVYQTLRIILCHNYFKIIMNTYQNSHK